MRTRGYGLLALVPIAIAVRMSVVQPAQTSETNRNREVVRRHLELMNRGDWRQAAEFFAPDCATPFRKLANRDRSRVPRQNLLTDNLDDIFRTFPDWKMEIVEMVARAVNGGFLVGVQPTGKHFEVQHIHWYKIRDGMITDHSTSRDDLGMTQQLGLLPPHQ
jgi:ketosteroid isomerase-like protein